MKIYADEIKAMVERVDAKLAPLCDYGGGGLSLMRVSTGWVTGGM